MAIHGHKDADTPVVRMASGTYPGKMTLRTISSPVPVQKRKTTARNDKKTSPEMDFKKACTVLENVDLHKLGTRDMKLLEKVCLKMSDLITEFKYHKEDTARSFDHHRQEIRTVVNDHRKKTENTIGEMQNQIIKTNEQISHLENQLMAIKMKYSSLPVRVPATPKQYITPEQHIWPTHMNQNYRSAQPTIRDQVVLSGNAVANALNDNISPREAGIKLISDKLDVQQIEFNEIEFHSFGRNDKKCIVATIPFQQIRIDLLVSSRRMKNVDFSINENLTPESRHLLFELRVLKRNKRIFTAFSRGGNIYFVKFERGPRQLIKFVEELARI